MTIHSMYSIGFLIQHNSDVISRHGDEDEFLKLDTSQKLSIKKRKKKKKRRHNPGCLTTMEFGDIFERIGYCRDPLD